MHSLHSLMSATTRMKNNEVSLYIHVPFCWSKCAYCAFYSFVPKTGHIERWLACVSREIADVKYNLPDDTAFGTIYIGGGTPSLLDIEQWKTLFNAIDGLPRAHDCEFTVEANPDSLDVQKISLLKGHGVNRISIGVQSLCDNDLKICGRVHTTEQALRAIDLSLKADFRVSADLIFGLPRQTLRSWHNSMSKIILTGISHLSIYQLMIETDSFWGRHTPKDLPDGYPMYRWSQYYLPRKGLAQYEIASFARPGEESRHNLAYWRRTNVYAAGPAAWGFIDGRRFANYKDFNKWSKCIERGISPVAYEEKLSGAAEASEAAVLALRTSFGIDYTNFANRYGRVWLEEILKRLHSMPEADFIWREHSVALSARGMRVGNAIWSELVGLEEGAV